MLNMCACAGCVGSSTHMCRSLYWYSVLREAEVGHAWRVFLCLPVCVFVPVLMWPLVCLYTFVMVFLAGGAECMNSCASGDVCSILWHAVCHAMQRVCCCPMTLHGICVCMSTLYLHGLLFAVC